uniref:Uncharacterized protein n=1 Tax=Panagrolaimus sp. JU765 TaxID=591449 RepID=A0AC34R9T4_9BILA
MVPSVMQSIFVKKTVPISESVGTNRIYRMSLDKVVTELDLGETYNGLITVNTTNMIVMLNTELSIGDKLVYVKLEEKRTIFELYEMVEQRIAERVNYFCVNALLDKQLTVYTDFDIILFALGIKKGEAHLILENTQGREREYSTAHHNSILRNYKNPLIYPKAVKNYKSQPSLMGIDLGTTHLCLAVSRNDRIDVIPIDESNNLWTPSVIHFTEQGPLVGKIAINGLQNEPDSVIYCPKMLPSEGVGQSFGYNLGSMVQYPYPNENPVFYVKIAGKIQEIPLNDVVTILIETIQKSASIYQFDKNHEKEAKQAVVTVPQWRSVYHTPQYELLWSKAIIAAGLKLGIEILDIIPEVYADFLYYLSKYHVEENKNILVIDCGGGRTTCQGYWIFKRNNERRIIHLADPVEKSWEALYMADVLGGVHFDSKIADKMNEILLQKFHINAAKTTKTRYNLFKKIQIIKEIITQENEGIIDLSDIDSRLADEKLVLKKEMFNDVFKEIAKRYSELLHYWKEKYDFDIIFLAGGSNRMPILQNIVRETFPHCKIIMDGEVEIITATGAAIHGLQILNKETVPLSDFKRNKLSNESNNCCSDLDYTPLIYVLEKKATSVLPAFEKLLTTRCEDSNHIIRLMKLPEEPEKSKKNMAHVAKVCIQLKKINAIACMLISPLPTWGVPSTLNY